VIQGERVEAMNAAVEARRMAQHSDSQKSIFLAFLCHELRNPLHAVANMISFMEDAHVTDQQKGYIDASKILTRYMNDLVDDVLDTGKFEAGMVKMEHIPLNLHETIRSLLVPFGAQLTSRSIHLETDLDSRAIHVLLDPMRIKQMISNFLSNALKFTPKNGTIRVELKYHDCETPDCVNVEIKVSDTGVGIEPQILTDLFKPYVQAHISTAREYGGSGLGLAICKQTVDAMGGSISVETEVNRGSCFTIIIPAKICKDVLPSDNTERLSTSDSHVSIPIGMDEFDSTFDLIPKQCISVYQQIKQQDEIESSCTTPKNNQPRDVVVKEGISILIVDDSAINRKILKKLFNNLGVINIDECKNGQEAVDKVVKEKVKYDLAFMDLQMPVMEGQDAIKLIRAANLTIPFVAVTAKHMENQKDIDDLLQNGFTELAPKPFMKADALKVLAHYCLDHNNP
jgi:two-component system, sensor histidine kinase